MRGMKFAVGLAALVSIAAAPADPSRIADFRVGGMSFSLPIPSGYCLPVDRQADIAQMLAAADTVNVTDLTLMTCDKTILKGANDYTVIKTPRTALLASVDRATLLAQVGKEFDTELRLEGTTGSQTMDKASKALSDIFGGAKVSISGSFLPRGKDEVCAYMTGVLHYETLQMTYDQPLAGCITAVGNRIFYIYRAGTAGDPASLLQLMREARALALAIKPISGT